MKKLVADVNVAFESIGDVYYGATEAEVPSLKFRRSLYVVKSMKKGEPFTPENIRSIRPANGLSTKLYEDVIGRKAACDIGRGVPLEERMIVCT